MTLKTYLEWLSSQARTKPAISISGINAESIADITLEAVETMERASLVIDPIKYPLLLSRIQNWLDKVQGPQEKAK